MLDNELFPLLIGERAGVSVSPSTMLRAVSPSNGERGVRGAAPATSDYGFSQMPSQSSFSPKTVILLLFVALSIGAGAAGVYLADRFYYKPLREQKQLIENLKSIVERLTKEVRVAEVAVLEQTQNPLTTKIRFVEVDEHGEKIGEAKTFTIHGNEAYFDSLVIKFEERFKPLDEPALKDTDAARHLLDKSIILFRRIFSEKQKPEDGFPLDIPGQPPEPYLGKTPPSQFEQNLWKDFWALANDPKLAKERGVRAAHGQAVSIKLQPNKYYVLERRLSGDMTIRPVDVPAVMRRE